MKTSNPRLRVGLKAQVVKQVPFEWTIAHIDSRLPAVLSTPAMIGMMEIAAAIAVQPKLALGTITVGTHIEVDHLKAVGVGARVTARARLTEINGRFLCFEVEARVGRNVIGRGRVYRAIVEPQGFNEKAAKRR